MRLHTVNKPVLTDFAQSTDGAQQIAINRWRYCNHTAQTTKLIKPCLTG